MKVYLKRIRTNVDAVGEYNEKDNSLVVLKGSVISDTISTAPKFGGKKSINKIRNGVIENNVLKENISFKSPSTAANFVTGSSCNGLISWKTKDGKKIKDLKK